MKTMKPKKASVGARIVQGLQEFADALRRKEPIAQQFNCRVVELDLEPTPYNPELVKTTRKLLSASQKVFARFLGASVQAVRSWEQGINTPSDMACRFMDEIRRDPDYWRKRLREATVVK
jgi:DNA-binding transcriptional regulator YiaG